MAESFSTGKKRIGGGSPCYIIAEMSANHGGDWGMALEIIRAASDAGADCIKIQTYTADTITISCDNEYFRIKDGIWKGETLYSLYKRAHTPWEWHESLKLEAERLGLDFLSTAFDMTSADFLDKMGVGFFKISSFELADIPLVTHIASKGKPIILSTGMATFEEISEAVAAARACGNNAICLMKCTSAYPAAPEDMNLRTIEDMKKNFNVPVGLSDHTPGSIAAIAAVALGANVIEKHLCISREIKTPDSAFSMEYGEFKEMVRNIRETEKALGKASYDLTDSEKQNRLFKKSIFAVKNIKKGDIFTEDNVRVIRPGYGLEPKYYRSILGKTAACDIRYGTPLRHDQVDIAALAHPAMRFANLALPCRFPEKDRTNAPDNPEEPAVIAEPAGQINLPKHTGSPVPAGILTLPADRLILREIAESDENDVVRWRNQKDIAGNMFSRSGPTLSEHREWYRRYVCSRDRKEFIIIRNVDGKKLGTVGLSNIDAANRKAELGILLGEAEERGKGYAAEACRACIRYGFEMLGLQKIYIRTLSKNRKAVKLFKKLGFAREGLLKKEIIKDGVSWDVEYMAIYKEGRDVRCLK